MTPIDRRIWWISLIVAVAVALWFLLDHALLPTLPVPAGTPPIMR